MKVVYEVDIKYMKAWRAKENVITMLRGGLADGYGKMPRYIYMLNQVPVVVVDGAHLSGPYEGTFVSASTLDGAGFLEEVRILFAAWNCKNNEIASYTNTTLGRIFEEILTHNGVKALRMTVKPVGSYLYCVYDSGWGSQTIVKTYELPIVSMPDKKDWSVPGFVDDEEILPPKYRRPPSRPKKERHLKSSESLSSNSNRCGKCG
ncbi:uncharacterized protein LOC107879377 [Capsicum annuum]|uniref:uncharacterized protein LOC107879377 n=1 Tax=Capsicum annuum TaxID=4072 RepID=UPI0007BEDDB2|nr:uncharacterized protein LOC107879377 [Capsicum annuum]